MMETVEPAEPPKVINHLDAEFDQQLSTRVGTEPFKSKTTKAKRPTNGGKSRSRKI